MRLHKYQVEACNFLFRKLTTDGGAGLWLEPGLGKTITSLRTIDTLRVFGVVDKVLIVAPARVIATSWTKEIDQWGIPVKTGWLKGDEKERQAVVDSNPDVYFVGCENLSYRVYQTKRKTSQMAEWLMKSKIKFDLVLIDEVTKFKNWSASRSKVLRKLLPRIPYRITLTGTPSPNGLGDVFSQHYILDSGKTLTPYITHFRNRFMKPCGFENRQWEMRPDMVKPLQDLLAPWYMTGTALEHLDMPELIHNPIMVDLPDKAKKIYRDMQKELRAELENTELIALSGSGRYSLCRQIASGSAYDEDGNAVCVHDAKLDALEDLFEELNGKPLLVVYWYNHELDRLAKRFPLAAVINGATKDITEVVANWQKGKIKMIIAQAGVISHGVDGLQKGCNDLVWFTLTDQPEVKFQLERRIYRQGVSGQVRIHYLLARSTLDKVVLDTHDKKECTQRDLMEAIKNAIVAR